MTRLRFKCGQATACGRPILASGNEHGLHALMWYECPKCRRVSGDHRRSRAWVWTVCDFAAPDGRSDTEGVKRSRSSALRAVGREMTRRAAQ